VLNDANADAVASICRRLDGIPLALELAAARLATFSVADLEGQLDDRFRFLTSGRRTAVPRHQTLTALVEWSYDLLTSPEQTLLRYLSVFAGGFTLDAAQRLCADDARIESDIADLVSSVTKKNLIQIEEHTDPLRYRMLDTIRQFSLERMRDRDEESLVRTVHASVFLALAESAAPHLWSAERLEWLGRIDAEQANLREAMTALIADPSPDSGPLAMRLFIALSRYWEMTGQAAYVLDTAHCLLSHPGTQQRDALWVRTVAALALVWRGDNWELAVFAPVIAEAAELAVALEIFHEGSVLHWAAGGDMARRGELAMGTEWMDRAVDDARQSGDLTTLGVALIASSVAVQDSQTSRMLLTEALSCLRRSGDEYWEPIALNNLACADMVEGDLESARRVLNQGIGVLRVGGSNSALASLLSNLGEVELAEGKASAAQAAFAEAIQMQIRAGLLDHTSGTLIAGIAGCASAFGDLEAAAFLYGAAHAVTDRSGIGISEWVDHHEGFLRTKTTESAFNAAFAQGHSLGPRAALKAALAWSTRSQRGALNRR
jgi:hypothetical protein